jgi:hypothetical protein
LEHHKVLKIKQATSNNDAFVYQGDTSGQMFVSSANFSKEHHVMLIKGDDNRVHISQNNWDNRAETSWR